MIRSSLPAHVGDDASRANEAAFGIVISEALRFEAARLERQLRDIGECLWTAADTVVIETSAGGSRVVPWA